VSAPPYKGEGPHALWHVSEDPAIERFEPRDGRVWAIDTRHLPLYWFPRDCPRATFWAVEETTDDDVDRFLDGDRTRRAHVIEPEDRYWISSAAVEAARRLELWDRVVASTLDFSGIRLRNATLAR
jgi:hypothetical protein